MELANIHLRENFSNAVSQEEIEAGTKLTEQLIAAKAARDAADSASGCTKPFFNVGKKKKEYEACLEKNKADKRAATEALKKALADSVVKKDVPKKKAFISTPAGIVVTILGTIVIGTGIYLAVKHFNK